MRATPLLLLLSGFMAACSGGGPDECSEESMITVYTDLDRDGHGDPTTGVMRCELTAGYSSTGLDCDDTQPDDNPDSLETCDGRDNDCDQQVDEGLRNIDFYEDADGDSWGNVDNVIQACAVPDGYADLSGDCNDTDALSFPGSVEFCDGDDNDCDGLVDDDDPELDIDTTTPWYLDADGDTYGNPLDVQMACEAPAPNRVDNGLDCNDFEETVSPDALEICDGFDNDCDGRIDDSDSSLDPAGLRNWFYDGDGDGFGDPGVVLQSCAPAWFYVENNTDCDDAEVLLQDAASGQWWPDVDGDGYGTGTIEGPSCTPPGANYVLVAAGEDCVDDNILIYPLAVEVCDGFDNDCDGDLDDADADLDVATTTVWYADVDGDFYGDVLFPTNACLQPADMVADATDCDDLNIDVNPLATEVCNAGIDDNCNGFIDEDDATLDPSSTLTWYFDFDQDTYGDITVSIDSGSAPLGYVDNSIDCDDNDPAVIGLIDWIDDNDGDGFGALPVVGNSCTPPTLNSVPAAGDLDCDDNLPDVFPGAIEVCGDGFDQHCLDGDQVCPPDTCAQAMAAPVLSTNTFYAHDLSLYADNVSFPGGNTCTGNATNGGDAILPVRVAPGASIRASGTNLGDASLMLLSSCVSPNPNNDCVLGSDQVSLAGSDETVWYQNNTGSTEDLFLVVDCKGVLCADFTLDLTFGTGFVPDTCVEAEATVPLTTGGATVSGSLATYTDDLTLSGLSCTGFPADGLDGIIPVVLQDNESLDVIEYIQIANDASVYLVSDCTDPVGTCVTGADATVGGEPESFSYFNGSGGEESWFLVLDCWDAACTDFLLDMSIQ
ncbi:MAG: hypothetical protein GWP91_08115 [Rhodobacterales bacterium]|nr:hypothetical protein [Rhodobacterales bacterium]